MGVMPGMYHQSELHLTDINVEPRMDENGEMRILGIEATLQVRLIVYEERRSRYWKICICWIISVFRR